MDCSVNDAQFQASSYFSSIPVADQRVIKSASDNEIYLSTLAQLSIQPQYTSIFLTHYESIFPELVARWLRNGSCEAVAGALARILPVQSYLKAFAQQYLLSSKESLLSHLSHISTVSSQTDIDSLPAERTRELLLCLYRLLMFRRDDFIQLIDHRKIYPLLRHSSRVVQYLAIRILCILLRSAENVEEQMRNAYLGEDAIIAEFEGCGNVDYGFLTWVVRRTYHENIIDRQTDYWSQNA